MRSLPEEKGLLVETRSHPGRRRDTTVEGPLARSGRLGVRSEVWTKGRDTRRPYLPIVHLRHPVHRSPGSTRTSPPPSSGPYVRSVWDKPDPTLSETGRDPV